jgi:hypothetical protein
MVFLFVALASFAPLSSVARYDVVIQIKDVVIVIARIERSDARERSTMSSKTSTRQPKNLAAAKARRARVKKGGHDMDIIVDRRRKRSELQKNKKDLC